MLESNLHKMYNNLIVQQEFNGIDSELTEYLKDAKYGDEGGRIQDELNKNMAGMESNVQDGVKRLYNNLFDLTNATTPISSIGGLEGISGSTSWYGKFIDLISRLVGSIFNWITEVFFNKISNVEDRLRKLKSNYKLKNNKSEATYPDSITTLITTNPENYDNLKWVKTNLAYLNTWFGNIIGSYDFLDELATKKIAEEDLGHGFMISKKLSDIIKEDSTKFIKIVGKGLSVKERSYSNTGDEDVSTEYVIVDLPGNYTYTVKSGVSNINTSPVILSKDRKANTTEIMRKVKKTKLSPNSDEISDIIEALTKLLAMVESKYKTPTTVGRALEKTVRSTMSSAKYSDEAKGAAAKYYSMILKWVKESTEKPLLALLTAMDAAIAVCNNCLE